MEFLNPRSSGGPASKPWLRQCLEKSLTCELKGEIAALSSSSASFEGRVMERNFEGPLTPPSDGMLCCLAQAWRFLQLPFEKSQGEEGAWTSHLFS